MLTVFAYTVVRNTPNSGYISGARLSEISTKLADITTQNYACCGDVAVFSVVAIHDSKANAATDMRHTLVI